jgi:hypothetical protein
MIAEKSGFGKNLLHHRPNGRKKRFDFVADQSQHITFCWLDVGASA